MHPDVLTISYSDPKAPTLFENSLKNTGFAIIKNHSIETDLINRVYDEWNSYFSSDSKMDFIFDEKKQDGYFCSFFSCFQYQDVALLCHGSQSQIQLKMKEVFMWSITDGTLD